MIVQRNSDIARSRNTISPKLQYRFDIPGTIASPAPKNDKLRWWRLAIVLGIVLLVLSLWIVTTISAPDSGNLLENPGFEEPDPANWSNDGDFLWFWSYSWSSSQAHSGTHSAGIDINPTWASWYRGWWQSTPPVTVTAGLAYTFSGWIKTEDAVNQAFLTLVFLDATGREITTWNSSPVSGSTDEWVQVQRPLPVNAPLDAVFACIRCQLWNSGRAWFDDILLQPVQAQFVDLKIDKIASSTTAEAGEQLTYTISCRNDGNLSAEDVAITDILPLSVTLSYANPPTYTQPAPGMLKWDVGDLAGGGESLTFTVVVTVHDDILNGQWLTNTATVSAENGNSNTAQIATEVTSDPKLIVNKSVSSESGKVSVYDTLRYTLTYQNVGGAVATDVWLTDSLPLDVVYTSVSVTPTSYSTASHQLIWELPSLEARSAEENIVIAVTVEPSAGGQVLHNCVELRSHETYDSDCANVWVPPPVLVLEGRPKPVVVVAGGWLTYTLIYTNVGSGWARDVVLTDVLPPGVTLTYAGPLTPTQPASRTLVWELGDLVEHGMPHTVTVVVEVEDCVSGDHWLTNTATIVGRNADSVTDSATTKVKFSIYLPIILKNYPPMPDFRTSHKTVALRVDDSKVVLDYTINLTNTGSLTASLRLTDEIPGGTTYIMSSVVPTVCEYISAENRIICNELEVGIDQTRTISFSAEADHNVCCIVNNAAWIEDGFHPPFTLTATVPVTPPLSLVLNGGFEAGYLTCWRSGGSTEVVPRLSNGAPPLTGSFSALLGRPGSDCKHASNSTAWIEQKIVVPSTISPTLFFSYKIFTYDRNRDLVDKYDSLDVLINGELELRAANRTGRYKCQNPGHKPTVISEPGEIDLSDYSGQHVAIRFVVRNTDEWYNTWVYIDDIRITP